MSVRAATFVVIRLEGDAQPDDVAAERVFWTREEAEAEVEHLNKGDEDSTRRYVVKESHFFSGSAAPSPDDLEG